jgi:hypothetical protein
MHTHHDGSTPVPSNAFTPEYLELLAERDEPVTAAAGPWQLEPYPEEGWAVLRQGESLESSAPWASFQKKDAARLAAAVLPSTGRPSRYRLGKDPDALGYPILDADQVVGHFQFFNEDLLAALNVVDALVSSPGALAWLLDAAGGLALGHAGKIAVEHTLPEF